MSDIKRDETIDIARGIGIILMVWGHVNGPFKTPYIYLFHMALFFLISGYTYSFREENSFFQCIKKRLNRLYVPHVISALMLVFLTNFFIHIHILDETYRLTTAQTYIKKIVTVLLFGGGDSLLGANWFLRSLFFGLIIYDFEHRFIGHKIYYLFAINSILIILGWVATIIFGHGKWFNILSVPILLDLGAYAKTHGIINVIKKYWYALLPLSLLAIIILGQFGEVSLNNNRIVNPVFFIISGIAGFVLTISFINIIKISRMVNNMLIYLGKHTMSIVLLHYISLKLVTYLQILLWNMDINNLSAYPTLVTDGMWWMIYLLAGIVIPVFFDRVISSIKNGMIVRGKHAK